MWYDYTVRNNTNQTLATSDVYTQAYVKQGYTQYAAGGSMIGSPEFGGITSKLENTQPTFPGTPG